MSKFTKFIDCKFHRDSIDVGNKIDAGSIAFNFTEYPDRCGAVYLSPDEAMRLASHIVRVVYGERKPRVWDRFEDVPDRVEVSFLSDDYDESTSLMKFRGHTVFVDAECGVTEPWEFENHHPNDYAPFTEVL